jgi:hypothetical protein
MVALGQFKHQKIMAGEWMGVAKCASKFIVWAGCGGYHDGSMKILLALALKI